MALPVIETPRYELTLPSQDVKVQYRPFLVKEEKILMMAMESKDNKEIISAMKDVLTACTYEKLDISKLPMFDLEYILLQVRGKSVGEQIEVMVTCPDDEKTQVPMSINIDSIKVEKSKDHKTDIKLDEQYTLKMRYPSLNEFIKTNFSVDEMKVDDTFDLIASCIDQIYSEEESWTQEDCTKKEMVEFLEQLNSSQFKEIETFFETMPKLSHKVKVKNPNTGVESEIVLEGLQNFFG